MQKKFTKEFMVRNRGCYSLVHLMSCSFMKSDPILLESIILSEIPLRDKYWFVCKKVFNKEQNQRIAIDIAGIVLPIFEKRYPEDKRPREAIEAAKQFITGRISIDQLMQKRRATAAAAIAADYAAIAADYAAIATAAAAIAADYAAIAADYAAIAAAAADYAAIAAAGAADYAAIAADVKQQLLDLLIAFISDN